MTYTKIDWAFDTQECCHCGVIFGVPEICGKNYRKTKQTFYCPNGHGQSYTESEAERLQKIINSKNTEIQNLKNEIDLINSKKRKKKTI